MDFIDDKKQTFKHYCRVCKKGFMCGRALGGHMRAHGIGDDNVNLDDDYDHTSDSDGGSDKTSNNNKRIYKLRTNPNRLKSCRACEHCGKEFLCWKSFLEHGKCSSNDAYESEGGDAGERRGIGWSKRKRSMRSKIGDLSSVYPACEEEDLLLAQCLVQLANTIVEPMPWPEESSSSASHEEERRDPTVYFSPNKAKGPSNAKGLFECKACKKVFNSHQALGGHRASHKKVKGCYAVKQDQYDNSLAEDDIITQEELLYPSKPTSPFHCEQVQVLGGATKRKSKVHECSICHRVFSSGQALGGHKRCHWIVSNSQNTSSLAKFQFQGNLQLVHQHQEPQSTNLVISNFQRSLLDPLNYEDGNNNNNGIANKIEDEANSKLQLSKLSDLNDFKEMDTPDNSSQWLQIGFGSTNEVAAAD